MKKNNSQRLILNVIILVISAFILIFMLMGKFLSSSNSKALLQESNFEKIYAIEVLIRDFKNA